MPHQSGATLVDKPACNIAAWPPTAHGGVRYISRPCSGIRPRRIWRAVGLTPDPLWSQIVKVATRARIPVPCRSDFSPMQRLRNPSPNGSAASRRDVRCTSRQETTCRKESEVQGAAIALGQGRETAPVWAVLWRESTFSTSCAATERPPFPKDNDKSIMVLLQHPRLRKP